MQALNKPFRAVKAVSICSGLKKRGEYESQLHRILSDKLIDTFEFLIKTFSFD